MHYLIEALDLNAHLFRVTLKLPASKKPRLLKLPVWIPGSYLIREFSRHIVRISAREGRQSLAIEQVKKNAWLLSACAKSCEVVYEVYAFDQSVRTAWLDADRGFFNGSSVFLYMDETRHQAHSVSIAKPQDARCKAWQVSTTLTLARNTKPLARNTKPLAFGDYSASNYDELIDKPVTLGELQRYSFKACGTPHEIVVTGAGAFDAKRLCADVQRICEAQIKLFDPAQGKAPFERYVFMLHASGDGYGGLEHRDSTALIAKRADLPQPSQANTSDMSEGYITLLGLFSHEYFHAWNVKRIKPARFEPYDLEQENMTRLLWLFEGFTSYYDDLMLHRAGLINEAQYLKLLSKTLTSVMSNPGRLVESVADASFNAWIKYYRADENSPNSTISYYQKGALVALALDALIRTQSKAAHTLDDVMRHLYARYLKGEAGVTEDGLPTLLQNAVKLPLATSKQFVKDHILSIVDADLPAIFKLLQIDILPVYDNSWGVTTLGGRLDARDEGVFVAMVYTGGALQKAGLAKGDLIVAVASEQANRTRWEAVRKLLVVGQSVTVHYFRDGLLHTAQLSAQTAGIKEWALVRKAAPPVSTAKPRATKPLPIRWPMI